MDNFEYKRMLKEIIVEFQTTSLPRYHQREISLPTFKRVNKIYVITGPRRVGKTYLLYQIIDERLAKGHDIEEILYLNFEDERIAGLRREQLHLILDGYQELYPEKKPILFLDEVQNVEGWELFVRRLQEKGYVVYITGSNAKLLSKEIATSLRGRTYTVELLPLSFKEFLSFKGVRLSKHWEYGREAKKVKGLFDEYVGLSGYPEVVLENHLPFIDEYFKSIFYRDIVDRYRIKNFELMQLLMKYLIKHYAKDFSINKFNNFAKSMGYASSTSVVQKYMHMLEESYFVFLTTVRKKGKAELSYSKKSYIVDHGFVNYYLLDKDMGRLLENIVFLELKRRGKNVHYFKNGRECDFITDNEAIQVTYQLEEGNIKRELGGLSEAMKKFRVDGLVLTYDEEKIVDVNGRKLEAVPIWKWLLNG